MLAEAEEMTMARTYTSVPTRGVDPGIGIHKPADQDARPVGLDSPAIEVLTDFRHVRPVTISVRENPESALGKMLQHHVRLLLVTDERGLLAGLVTSTDLEIDTTKPAGNIGVARGVPSAVSEVMTPLHQIEVMDLDDVLHARVGNVVATLRTVGRQHAMVVDYRNGAMRVRGLFSAAQLSRQLGVAVDSLDAVRGFARVGDYLGGANREPHDPLR
jgi:CBS domain-containing protein